MANSKKTNVFLALNLGMVGWTFYYYFKGIPVAVLAIVIPSSALICNAVAIVAWRVASKRSGVVHPAKDSASLSDSSR